MPSEISLHDHCQACYDRKCSAHLPFCDVVPCELDCGARFHACKRGEHSLLCGNARVECLNAGYGCPATVQRSQMMRHLSGCPASLVHCTMEWNRWPVCSSERQSHQPVQVLMDFNGEQLDMALALRDQRMLTKSMRASLRTRQILTNSLNRRHPAVPLSSQLTGGRGAEEGDFDGRRELENLLQDMHQWENEPGKKRSRSPAGLQQSICEELYRASHDTVRHLSSAIQAATGQAAPPADLQKPDFSLGSTLYPYIHCSHCERRKERLERLMDSHNAMRDGNGDDDEAHSHETTDDAPPCTNPNDDTRRSHQHDEDDDVHLKVIKQTLTGDLLGETPLRNGVDVSAGDVTIAAPDRDVGGRRSNSSSSSEGSLGEVTLPVLFVTRSTTGEVSAAPGRGHSKILVVEPPQMIPGSGVASFPGTTSDSPLQASLSLDLSLESITRYQAKPDSMYTFLCAQVFRRDEFASHFQNVHCDIHGGLNGWLEQRCPLAPYGCTYSQRRFYPGQQSARIVHNEHLESFGVQPDGNCRPTEPDEECSAGPDPVEMEWVHVGQYLKDGEDPEPASPIDTSGSGEPEADRPETGQTNHFTVENGRPEVSHPRSDKTAMVDAIGENRAGRSKSASSAVRPSGKGSRGCLDEAQLNAENASLKDGPEPQPLAVIDNSPRVAAVVPPRDLPGADEAADIPSPTAARTRGGRSDPSAKPDFLSQLPSEILRYLTRFLDGFSMCNLALTSKLLRQICCSVLEEKGMVLQQWEKQHDGRWEVAFKVWQFSTAFTPVLHWGFESQPSLAVHLARCPYNIRLEKTEPVRVMPDVVQAGPPWDE